MSTFLWFLARRVDTVGDLLRRWAKRAYWREQTAGDWGRTVRKPFWLREFGE